MKKIILLIVSGLLIACMAGSAMADPFTAGLYKTATGDAVGATIDLKPGETTQVYLGGYAFTPEYLGKDYTWTGVVESAPPGHSITDVTIELPSESFVPPISPVPSELLPYIDPHPIKITLAAGLENGLSYGIAIGATHGGVTTIRDYAVMSRTVKSIPEFPTIALPVAGVLGLLFVFGRKKEGL